MKIPAKFNDIEVLYKAYLAERKSHRDEVAKMTDKMDDLKLEIANLKTKAVGKADASADYYYLTEKGDVKFVDATKVVERNGKFVTKVTKRVAKTWFDGRVTETYYDKVSKWVEVKENK